MDRVRPESLYDIRLRMIEVETAKIEVARLQNLFNREMLLLEREYGLLATDSKLDINTGKITRVEDGKEKQEAKAE